MEVLLTMSEDSAGYEKRTQHCECGNETYNIYWTPNGDVWATCVECGRPTATVGIGQEKQREWYNEQ